VAGQNEKLAQPKERREPVARLDRSATIATSYGPKQDERYYQRRPGAPLVPLMQAYNEDRQGLDSIYGLNEGVGERKRFALNPRLSGFSGPNDVVAPERNYTMFATQGSRPKTEEDWIIQTLKGFGIHNPTKELVAAIAKELDEKDPQFMTKMNRLLGSVLAEQKIWARDSFAYQGDVLNNAITRFQAAEKKKATSQKTMDVIFFAVAVALAYTLYKMVS
jgi:hypothetical protein